MAKTRNKRHVMNKNTSELLACVTYRALAVISENTNVTAKHGMQQQHACR